MSVWDWLFGKRTNAIHLSTQSIHSSNGWDRADSNVALLEPASAVESFEYHPSDDAATPWFAPQGITRTEPLSPACPELSVEARALENLLISHFDGHDLTMPALLPVAEKALSQLRDANCSLAQVAKTIADDPVLTAAVFRMTNSALYRGIDKITSLPAAVSRLGVNAIRTLMMHESLRAAISGRRDGHAEWANLIWRRAVAGATIMRSLCRFTHVDEETAYLAGLLHDIGDIIVLRVVESQKRSIREHIDTETFEYLCSESHQEFGELIAHAWKLPANLASIISDHHSFPAADDPQRIIRLQLILTDMITSMLGYAHDVQYDLLNSQPVRQLNLQDNSACKSFLTELPDVLDDAVAAL